MFNFLKSLLGVSSTAADADSRVESAEKTSTADDLEMYEYDENDIEETYEDYPEEETGYEDEMTYDGDVAFSEEYGNM